MTFLRGGNRCSLPAGILVYLYSDYSKCYQGSNQVNWINLATLKFIRVMDLSGGKQRLAEASRGCIMISTFNTLRGRVRREEHELTTSIFSVVEKYILIYFDIIINIYFNLYLNIFIIYLFLLFIRERIL